MPPQGAAGPGAASLEDRVGLFDSIGNSLEGLVGAVKAILKVAKEAAYYTYYTAKAAAGLATGIAIAGTPTALILPAGIAAGALLANWKNKEKKTFKETYKQIANELAVGGILGGLLHHIFVGSNALGDVVSSAYGPTAGLLTKGTCAVAQMPPFLAAHEYLNRALIKGYKPKPLKDMGKQIKKMWPIIPLLIANFTAVPLYLGQDYQMPVAAGISVAYGLLKSEKKGEKKEEALSPYGLPPGYTTPKAA